MRLILMLLFPFISCAQDYSIRFSMCINSHEIELGKTYSIEENEIKIENLKFYISNISLYQKNKLVYKDSVLARLIDLENRESLNLKFDNIIKFDRIVFNLGIDSLTNVSGALAGDLDPTKGMYWTWQSGYINFKLEGTDPRCKNRHHRFQYHLGGYAYPFATIQEIDLKINKKVNKSLIILPIEKFLNVANPEKKSEIMSPSKEAVDLSNLLGDLFEIRS
jgi:hypothetical protein